MKFSTLKIGRILYGITFVIFGVNHFINASTLSNIVPIPGGVFWVYVTGLAMLAAAIAILTGKQARLACQLLGILLFIFVLTIHLPTMINQGIMAGLTNFLKDLALGGAAWVIAETYAEQPQQTEAAS
ncbi:DoxX family membrane protein [Rhodothermus profundi]|nr:DoxX family membrane protein [Rhodothermus profundi]